MQPVVRHESGVRSRTALVAGVAVAATMLAAACSPDQAHGKDTVILQSETASSRVEFHCEIIEYTGREITLQLNENSAPRTYPASRVVDVRTTQTPSQFETALAAETRAWVRREILAMLVRCARRLGDEASAGSRFLLLVKSDPATQHYKYIPLIWAPHSLSQDARSEARVWLRQSSETARLLAASFLLDDPDYRDVSEDELRTLSASPDRRVQQLARAQYWRTALRDGDVRHSELTRWEDRIGRMHADLRGGPYFLLGRGHALRNEHNRAAMAFLWLPLVYDHDHQLAARACLEAGSSLARIGQSDQAVTLFREVGERFADTEYAREARLLAEAVATGKGPGDSATDNGTSPGNPADGTPPKSK